MHFRVAVRAALLLLLAQVAIADEQALATRYGGPKDCSRYILCSGQTATGVCTAANAQCIGAGIPFGCCTGSAAGTCTGDEVTASFEGRYVVGLYATSSTATSFSCNLGTTDAPAYDTAGDTPATITADDASPLLTQTQRYRSVAAPLGRVWVNCTDIDGGAVTVTGELCPLGK